MKASFLLIAAALACVGVTPASAQGFGIYIGPSSSAYDEYDYYAGERPYRYQPRVYGYVRDTDENNYTTTNPRRGNTCGRYHYWDGEECVDARDR